MKSPSGYPLQSPYVSIATKYAGIMTRIASEFGFTPASRARLPSGLRLTFESRRGFSEEWLQNRLVTGPV